MFGLINELRSKILRREIYEEIRRLNPNKILDNGCGKNGSFDYNGFKNKVIRADITKGINCEKLPYKKESFDCVIFAGVIQYVDYPNKALSECYRVLKKDGTLLISTINKNSLINNIIGFRHEKRNFTMDDFIKFIKKYDFKILEFKFLDFFFVPKKYKMILYCKCKK